MTDYFTGYINLDGKHIKNGLTTRPQSFTVIEAGKLVELRWLVSRDEKRYEISRKYQIKIEGGKVLKVFIKPRREVIMKEGLKAGEEFTAYIQKLKEEQ